MKKFYPVSVLLFVGITALAILFSGLRFGYYISLPPLVIVVGFPAVMLFATHGPAEIRAAFRAAYQSSDPAELRLAVVFFSAAQRYLLWSGFIATLLGIVALLASLGDESHIGAAAALSLITVLYAIILNVIFALPFRHAAEKRLARVG